MMSWLPGRAWWSCSCLPVDILDLRRQQRCAHASQGCPIKRWTPTALSREPEPVAIGEWVTSPASGSVFQWTSAHLNGKTLDTWRLIGDVVVDDYLEAHPLKPDTDCIAQVRGNDFDDLGSAGKDHDKDHSAARARALLDTPPSWAVDWAAVERGQAVFVQHWPAACATLWFTSLVGGFSAPLITEVIRCTGYLTGPHPGPFRRLLETFQMVLACSLCGDAGLQPGGVGWETVLRVRFLHAKVRRRLLAHGAAPQGEALRGWESATYGVPINQEDLAVTLLAFSLNVRGASRWLINPMTSSFVHSRHNPRPTVSPLHGPLCIVDTRSSNWIAPLTLLAQLSLRQW